jgi:hypothetical protein
MIIPNLCSEHAHEHEALDMKYQPVIASWLAKSDV